MICFQIVSFLGGEAGQSTASTALISVLGVLAGLVAVALFLLVSLILLKRYSKQVCICISEVLSVMFLDKTFFL